MRRETPLRYPGGKARLGPFFGDLIRANGLVDGTYIEPYAGGAGVAVHLLLGEYVDFIQINDIDTAVFSFWSSVVQYPDDLCEMVRKTPLTPAEWAKQKVTLQTTKSTLKRGFALFYLNRTNRSGILNAGMIGGKSQKGKWGLDARFNREDLIDRIQRIARYKERIKVTNDDALDLLKSLGKKSSSKTLVYLDPPYYVKGQRLYANFYQHRDHELIAEAVAKLKTAWVVSYDDHKSIRKLYQKFPRTSYKLGYSARETRLGDEVMFVSPELRFPKPDERQDLGALFPPRPRPRGTVGTVR